MLKVKNITLFIMEIIILQQRKALTYEFTEELNDFKESIRELTLPTESEGE